MEMDPVADTAGESVVTASGNDRSPLAILAGEALTRQKAAEDDKHRRRGGVAVGVHSGGHTRRRAPLPALPRRSRLRAVRVSTLA